VQLARGADARGRMGDAGLRAVRENYDVGRMVEAYEGLWSRL
jgi:hypothetical protein